MKILVTGGAGYIGSHVVDMLMHDPGKHHVTVFDKGVFGYDSIIGYRHDRRFKLIAGDMLHVDEFFKAAKGADVIIHLAGIVGDPACNKFPEQTWLVNVELSRILLDIVNYYAPEKLIFASSCSVYGHAPDNELLTETSFLNPISSYAESKIDGESIMKQDINKKTALTIMRFGTIFGFSRRMRFDLVANLFTIKAVKERKIEVFGKGTQSRAFVHVRDAARAVVMRALESGVDMDNRTYNVVGMNRSIKDVANVVCAAIPGTRQEMVFKKEDDRNYRVSGVLIQEELGFHPEETLETGVCEMVIKIGEFIYDKWESDPKYQNHLVQEP